MTALHVPTLFAILGPLFLLFGLVRCVRAGSLHPQGRTWLLIGAIFTAVAVWLHLKAMP